jgi:hypothetical protein
MTTDSTRGPDDPSTGTGNHPVSEPGEGACGGGRASEASPQASSQQSDFQIQVPRLVAARPLPSQGQIDEDVSSRHPHVEFQTALQFLANHWFVALPSLLTLMVIAEYVVTHTGVSAWARRYGILQELPYSPDPEDAIRGLILSTAFVAWLAVKIQRSRFWKTVADLGWIWVLIFLAVTAVASAKRGDLTPPLPAAEPELGKQARDDSDVRHISPADGVIRAHPGETFTHHVRLLNTGDTFWKARRLCRKEGEQDDLQVLMTRCALLPDVAPHDSTDLLLEGRAPAQAGRYRVSYKLEDSDGGTVFVGAHPLSFSIIVEPVLSRVGNQHRRFTE